jgi:hypothetical protein
MVEKGHYRKERLYKKKVADKGRKDNRNIDVRKKKAWNKSPRTGKASLFLVPVFCVPGTKSTCR